jgi:hypothetical protein
MPLMAVNAESWLHSDSAIEPNQRRLKLLYRKKVNSYLGATAPLLSHALRAIFVTPERAAAMLEPQRIDCQDSAQILVCSS